MGLSFQEALEKDLKNIRELYIEEQESKASKRRPRRTGQKPAYGTLFALRNKKLAIREAALRKSQIILRYVKVTTGESKRYVVAPYSYRYRKLRAGRRKMLFAYDMKDKHIKGFVLKNIRKVAITDRKFRPKWRVEIG
jgi:predicted DNA-binding transcriptional regulator YafY